MVEGARRLLHASAGSSVLLVQAALSTALRLIETCCLRGEVHLVVTEAGWRVLKEELGWDTTKRQAALDVNFRRTFERQAADPASECGYRRKHCKRLVPG